MPVVCPAILAANEKDYRTQVENVAKVAHRLQVDLTDGQFAPGPTVRPEEAWWPVGLQADFHIMYAKPLAAVKSILAHKPNLVIVHAEAEGRFEDVITLSRGAGVKIGLALLPSTRPETVLPALEQIDHVLVFGGDLGHQGGAADLRLLPRVELLRARRPQLEIGWDGGVNEQNVSKIAFAGVDVITAGKYIQSAEDPERALLALQRIADETGTA